MNLDSFAAAMGIPVYREASCTEPKHSFIDELLGAELLAALRANDSGDTDAAWPLVHLRLEGTACQWLLTRIDGDGVAYGLCDPGTGHLAVMHTDLPALLIQLAHRRDALRCNPDFHARAPLAEYTRQACMAGHIVLDWDGAPPLPDDAASGEVIPLACFLGDYRAQLLEQIEMQTPVVYRGEHPAWQDDVLARLKRRPFPAQKKRIHAVYAGLVERGLPAVFLNGEMGTGKTMMGICVSALMQHGYSRKPVLVISPPHLVYKWRREILDTVPEASVTVINGSNAIRELMAFRRRLMANILNDGTPPLDPARSHYLIIGRVRMRMGFHWRPAYATRNHYFRVRGDDGQTDIGSYQAICCPHCGTFQTIGEGDLPVNVAQHPDWGKDRRMSCQNKACGAPLWTMCHQGKAEEDAERKLRKFLNLLPGIGKVTADKLIAMFGVEMLTRIVDDNINDFVNLCDSDGEFVFNDKQAARLEKSLGRLEFALRMISYQPSEFIKRYFPRKSFSLALIDEAHEYKVAGSAQGQAMAVLCGEAEKVLCLTGTLMGGYASDLFYLLFRAMPSEMLKLGFGPTQGGSFFSAEARFMAHYGCLIDVYKSREDGTFKTARGKKVASQTRKAPGFSATGIARFVLPYAVFMRLQDVGDVLPGYHEETRLIPMTATMREAYRHLHLRLGNCLRAALAHRDNSLTGVVINALLRWPDTCFRAETITHPRDRRDILAETASLFADDAPTPKEADVIDLCLQEKQQGRRVLVYTVYTGGHDTATRLRQLMQQHGLKAAVLRSTVSSDAREDWIADQVEHGIDVLITNPELVKTGLDLLAFPTIYFCQTGYNVYTAAQASRRSWRIGQENDVRVYYACYADSTQVQCLELMSKKIKTALSTMGVMPETGLDVFDEDESSEGSVVEALAKQLLGAR
ncbi:SNF2-related protein [Cardiobacterium hominis]|uniref:SNF2-related protein n=1 Tax=Cardiobacterium hominis TaxID=2718 RepID=UPI002490F7F6|nr:SNF2-related protein [Cardiobacterium hominis]